MDSLDADRMSDEALMRQVAAGDESALASLYRRYAGAVYSLAYRVVNNREVAEELLNEAFLRAWKQAPLFDARRGKFSTWVLSVTRNLSIDELRSQRSRPQKADPVGDEDMPIDLVDPGIPVEDQVWLREQGTILREALRRLPEAQREALELAYFQGLTQSEIAVHLEQPLGTTKTRMRLGLQKLRDILLADEVGREIS